MQKKITRWSLESHNSSQYKACAEYQPQHGTHKLCHLAVPPATSLWSMMATTQPKATPPLVQSEPTAKSIPPGQVIRLWQLPPITQSIGRGECLAKVHRHSPAHHQLGGENLPTLNNSHQTVLWFCGNRDGEIRPLISKLYEQTTDNFTPSRYLEGAWYTEITASTCVFQVVWWVCSCFFDWIVASVILRFYCN